MSDGLVEQQLWHRGRALAPCYFSELASLRTVEFVLVSDLFGYFLSIAA